MGTTSESNRDLNGGKSAIKRKQTAEVRRTVQYLCKADGTHWLTLIPYQNTTFFGKPQPAPQLANPFSKHQTTKSRPWNNPGKTTTASSNITRPTTTNCWFLKVEFANTSLIQRVIQASRIKHHHDGKCAVYHEFSQLHLLHYCWNLAVVSWFLYSMTFLLCILLFWVVALSVLFGLV